MVAMAIARRCLTSIVACAKGFVSSSGKSKAKQDKRQQTAAMNSKVLRQHQDSALA